MALTVSKYYLNFKGLRGEHHQVNRGHHHCQYILWGYTMQQLTDHSLSLPTIVLGVIGADCHAVGNKILMSVLSQQGFNVINLGVMVSQGEFIDAAIENQADAILVSSIYGHGEIDCQGFREHCNRRGLKNIILYVGGNLVIGKRPFLEVEKLFLKMGFDRVFSSSVDLEAVTEQLKRDIAAQQWGITSLPVGMLYQSGVDIPVEAVA